MAELNVGVVTQAQVNAGMLNSNGSAGMAASAATWSYIWFGVSVLFILCVYFGFGGHRGAVAS